MKTKITLLSLALISSLNASQFTAFLRGPSIIKSPAPLNPPAPVPTHVLTTRQYFLARFAVAQLAYEGAFQYAINKGLPTNTPAINQLDATASYYANIVASLSPEEGAKPYTGPIEFN